MDSHTNSARKKMERGFSCFFKQSYSNNCFTFPDLRILERLFTGFIIGIPAGSIFSGKGIILQVPTYLKYRSGQNPLL
jgi:hypothetical protein